MFWSISPLFCPEAQTVQVAISSMVLLSHSKDSVTKPIGKSIGTDYVRIVTGLSHRAPLLISRCASGLSPFQNWTGQDLCMYIHSFPHS